MHLKARIYRFHFVVFTSGAEALPAAARESLASALRMETKEDESAPVDSVAIRCTAWPLARASA